MLWFYPAARCGSGSIHHGVQFRMFSDVALEDKLARVNSVVHPYASDVVFYFLFRLRRMERAGEASPRAAEALAFQEKLGDASAGSGYRGGAFALGRLDP